MAVKSHQSGLCYCRPCRKKFTVTVGTVVERSHIARLTRRVFGVFHAVSEQHLQRYADEFAFRWNQRKVDDTDRTNAAIQGAAGKRLTYRPSDQG
jgi:hypothetical protein